MSKILEKIFSDIDIERTRQKSKWGAQFHSDQEWPTILGEEFGEVCKAFLEKGRSEELEAELIQVAAVAVAWLEDIRDWEKDIPF